MLYIAAADILVRASNKEGNIKSLVFATGSKDVKQLYALVCQTLKYSNVLKQVMTTAGLLQLEKWLQEPVARCLTYDLLFGKGIKCRGKFKRVMKRQQKSLEDALESVKKAANVTDVQDLLPQAVREHIAMPRYIRVNRLKTTPQQVEDAFKADGYECVLSREQADEQMRTTDPTINSTQCWYHIKNLQPKQFMADLDLSDVFVFPAGTDLHAHPLFTTRQIQLQDKASCVPATVLAPPPGSHVIDACAAPGNKTSHLASIMGNKGQIFAFDSSQGRYKNMNRLVPNAGVSIASLRFQDFLETNLSDEEFSSVEYLLVDPSCSGSGMVDRNDFLTGGDEGPSQDRLQRLSVIQLKLLNHALSFPKAKRVVYSTCSVKAEENEEVVKKALEENPGFKLKRVLPPWGQNAVVNKNAGQEDPEIRRINSLCLHSLPNEHLTNGFFVALFEKSNVKFDVMAQKGMKRKIEDEEEEEEEEEVKPTPKKKSKKKKNKENAADSSSQNGSHQEVREEMVESEHLSKSGKKKKRKQSLALEKSSADDNTQDESQQEAQESEEVADLTKSGKKKKKKQQQKVDTDAQEVTEEHDVEESGDKTVSETPSKSAKKKKRRSRKSLGKNL